MSSRFPAGSGLQRRGGGGGGGVRLLRGAFLPRLRSLSSSSSCFSSSPGSASCERQDGGAQAAARPAVRRHGARAHPGPGGPPRADGTLQRAAEPVTAGRRGRAGSGRPSSWAAGGGGLRGGPEGPRGAGPCPPPSTRWHRCGAGRRKGTVPGDPGATCRPACWPSARGGPGREHCPGPQSRSGVLAGTGALQRSRGAAAWTAVAAPWGQPPGAGGSAGWGVGAPRSGGGGPLQS